MSAGGVEFPIATRTQPAADVRFPRLGLVGIVLIGVAIVEAAAGLFASPMAMADHDGGVHGDHLLALVGMVLVLIGVLRDGFVRGAEQARAAAVREAQHAIR